VVGWAATGLGDLLAASGRQADAAVEYRRALDAGQPEFAPGAAVKLGDVLTGLGEPNRAREAYRRAISSGDPSHSADAALKLGLLLQQSRGSI
jgi:predicted negative regulator of RcsB-dependent stress response